MNGKNKFKLGIEEFKKELMELLDKYNASIDFDCDDCSDTHGIYNETMTITINNKEYEICKGWSIDKNDLK